MKPALEQWTIYFNPKDHPEKFVLRRWAIYKDSLLPVPTSELSVHDTLQHARSAVPEGLFRLDRFPEDDPVIVEVWL